MNPTYENLVREASVGPSLVDVKRDQDVAVVTMNDPEHLNALGARLSVQLQQVLAALSAETDVRTIILTGAGGAFSAGGDLRGMQAIVHPLVDDGDEGAVAMWKWIRHQFGAIVRTIVQSDKIFIAAIGGAAAGVGLAFALACDLIIASERARFVLAFGKIGLVTEVGTSWLLTRRLGYSNAFELYLSGKAVEAVEAERLGLVNEVVPVGTELARAREWSARVRALPAPALMMTKPLLRAAVDMTWHQTITMEEFAEPLCFTTTSHREAVRAMLDREPHRERHPIAVE
jgi:2-(1,2-epoxy-1,2-dihydrophenyl)acetyl-CoA isomerase